ncbi:uncharacterized protein ARMOST_17678 [Armillaria ostoyae]|uniref:Uncharacterized protein n=1 Tax=Armillaria ostoyae TaxID=47428 RepID=A0A284RZM8_ARMOS|nr:uncharacterized protein ARMOST_17678 [Armillaria ostoyae]
MQSLEALLVWTRTQTKALPSFDFLAQSITNFAPPMVAIPRSQCQPEQSSERVDHAIGVLDSTPLKPSKTKISPSNTAAFAVVPTMPPRSNRERAMSNDMSTSYSLSPYIPSASFHRRFPNLSQHKATEAYDRSSKLPAQLTLTGDVLTNPKAQISMGMRTSCKAA